MADDKTILFEKDNRCGVITLNRPGTLNALNYDMIAALERHYADFTADPHIYAVILQSSSDRAFCSGGDIRAIYEMKKAGKLDTILELYGTEYQHNWRLDRFLKPHVALIDGIVFGGGVGASLYGTHRVAGAGYKFAMPEAGIGFFPDVGATWFLPRLRGKAGLYLALTGRSIGPADAFHLGLVTHCIDSAHFPAIRRELSDAQPVDPMLDSFHRDPGESEIARMQPVMDRLFEADSVQGVLDNLDAEQGEFAEWAKTAAAEIRTRSPTSLCVAFEQVKRGSGMTLDQALKLEFAIARRFMEGDEFFEGIRAALIDKDGKPAWSPSRLEDVSPESIERYFEPLVGASLELMANPVRPA
jgi:enoyl-CoA hydratase